MTESSNPPQSQLGPAASSAMHAPWAAALSPRAPASTRKHIADCQIPMWSPFVPGGEGIVLGRLWTARSGVDDDASSGPLLQFASKP